MTNLSLLLLCCIIFGCNSDVTDVEKVRENVTIAQSETLNIFLSKGMPVEGGISITKQA